VVGRREEEGRRKECRTVCRRVCSRISHRRVLRCRRVLVVEGRVGIASRLLRRVGRRAFSSSRPWVPGVEEEEEAEVEMWRGIVRSNWLLCSLSKAGWAEEGGEGVAGDVGEYVDSPAKSTLPFE